MQSVDPDNHRFLGSNIGYNCCYMCSIYYADSGDTVGQRPGGIDKSSPGTKTQAPERLPVATTPLSTLLGSSPSFRRASAPPQQHTSHESLSLHHLFASPAHTSAHTSARKCTRASEEMTRLGGLDRVHSVPSNSAPRLSQAVPLHRGDPADRSLLARVSAAARPRPASLDLDIPRRDHSIESTLSPVQEDTASQMHREPTTSSHAQDDYGHRRRSVSADSALSGPVFGNASY